MVKRRNSSQSLKIPPNSHPWRKAGELKIFWSLQADRESAKLVRMQCRGVRGATTVDHNNREEILTATRQLLALMLHRNGIDKKDIASAIFTTTPDLDAEFPALAARQLDWLDVPLLCGHEMTVPGSLAHCIRVLIHWNTEKSQAEIQHTYIREAEKLRPDHCELPEVNWNELEDWINAQMKNS